MDPETFFLNGGPAVSPGGATAAILFLWPLSNATLAFSRETRTPDCQVSVSVLSEYSLC